MIDIDLTNPQRYNFGCFPDIPDIRDVPFTYKAAANMPLPNAMPQEIDLTNRAEWPSVDDQQESSSCVGQTLIGALEYEQIKRLTANGKFAGTEFLSKKLRFKPSRLFAYYEARKTIGLEGEDSGCYIRDAIKVAYNIGVPRETGWKFVLDRVTAKPPRHSYKSAPFHKITKYQPVLVDVNEVRKALAEDFPILIGFAVFNSFFRYPDGNINLPTYRDYLLGWHAVLIVGYNDQTQRFKFRNSWGEEWGTGGYGTLPYAYIGNRNLADDFWILTDSEYKERLHG